MLSAGGLEPHCSENSHKSHWENSHPLLHQNWYEEEEKGEDDDHDEDDHDDDDEEEDEDGFTISQVECKNVIGYKMLICLEIGHGTGRREFSSSVMNI